MNLDIHLDSRDTVLGTGYLEVHISEEILQTLDIGQYQIVVIGLPGNQSAGNTGNHLLDGTPAAIRAMQEAQVDAMEVERWTRRSSDTARMA